MMGYIGLIPETDSDYSTYGRYFPDGILVKKDSFGDIVSDSPPSDFDLLKAYERKEQENFTIY
jgi:hypothetical protein